ncbi:MAG: glycosyltransferase family 39 protein [Ignavibacteriae bacterium]|nr:glycosyltransferase family 39 protein [Ignavibacteria bacterium]MBI3364534.1 glycosyltransferase family 39 protein [Ignavibacteriota bacterium]
MRASPPIRDKPAPSTAQQLLIAFVFIVVAGILRFYRLEEQSLWNDEMFSLDVASSALNDIQPKLIAYYHHPPLFFYIAHFALQLFGYSAWALRSSSAFSGSLTVGLTFFVTARLFNQRAGFAAGIFCLLAPFHLAYSQEGRPYALAGFLCLSSTYLMYSFIERKTILKSISYVLSTVALLYTHHWGIFVIVAQVVVTLAVLRPKRQTLVHCVILWAVITILYVPETLALRQQVTSHDPNGWFWVQRPSIQTLEDLSMAFGGTFFKMASSIFDSPEWMKIAALLILATLLMIASFIAFTLKDRNMHFILAILFLVTFVPCMIAFIKPEVFLWYRYTVIVFPLFCVAVGGIVRSDRRNVFVSLGIALLLVIAAVNSANYFSWQKSSVKEVAAYVQEATRDSVRMIIRPHRFAPLLNYYYRGDAIQFDESYLDQPLGEIVDTSRSFVYISLDIPNTIRDYMDYHFDKIDERKFPGEAHMGMVVGVYRQKPEETQEAQ